MLNTHKPVRYTGRRTIVYGVFLNDMNPATSTTDVSIDALY